LSRRRESYAVPRKEFSVRFERIPPYFYLILLLGLAILFLLLADHVGFREKGNEKARMHPGIAASVLDRK
jgi:hypothetical protein